MTLSKSIEQLLERAHSLSGGASPDAPDLERLLGSLSESERALAASLLELARKQGAWRREMVQVGKLSEVGLAMAELVHELRQPLTAISGFAQLADSKSGWPAEILAQTERMAGQLERMRRFLKPCDEQLGEVPVAEAIREAVALHPKMPPACSLEVEIGAGLPAVKAEKNQLLQVLGNLLNNARDALTEDGGKVLVTAALEAGKVRVCISDQGRGLAPEIAPRLFEPFATTKGENGTGLGLYLCRELVQGWGAELDVAPPPASFRTCFAIDLLPAQETSAPARPPGTPVIDASSRRSFELLVEELEAQLSKLPRQRRVLVVEDEASVRRALKVLLASDSTLTIAEAVDGPAAIELLNAEPAPVLVCDRKLPGMTGLELIAWARERKMPLEALLVTGQPTPESIRDAMDLGVSDYLVKPFGQADLLRAAVRRLMERAIARQRLDALAPSIRTWADRLVQVAPEEPYGPKGLRRAAMVLASKDEGPARSAVVADVAISQAIALAGHRADRVLTPELAESALIEGTLEVLVLSPSLAREQTLDLARRARTASWPAQVVFAGPVADFATGLELIQAGVGGQLAQPADAKALGGLLARAAARRRHEIRALALARLIDLLGIERADKPTPAR